jgi:hypothetical protein
MYSISYVLENNERKRYATTLIILWLVLKVLHILLTVIHSECG